MSTTVRTSGARQRIIGELALAWEGHPDWSLGRLISSAASISRGQLRMNPREVTDSELRSGFRALLPDEDEPTGGKSDKKPKGGKK